jgi:ketosteroid isomerase-like protein
MLMKKVFIILCVLISSICAMSQQPGTTNQQPSINLPAELDRVLRDYEAAWTAKDSARLSQLFAEDGYVLPNGNPPAKGRAAIAAFYNGQGGPLFLRAIAYASEGKVGYIIGGFAGTANSPDEGKFTLTLRKSSEGRWLIVSDMDNANRRRQPPPQP